jgi:hypothetical protein
LAPGEYVVRSAWEFHELLSRVCNEKQALNFEKWNAVDFEKQMLLIGVYEAMSGGHELRIHAVWQSKNEIVVEVHGLYPGAGAVTCATELLSDSVRVPRSELPVRFFWRWKCRTETPERFP